MTALNYSSELFNQINFKMEYVASFEKPSLNNSEYY